MSANGDGRSSPPARKDISTADRLVEVSMTADRDCLIRCSHIASAWFNNSTLGHQLSEDVFELASIRVVIPASLKKNTRYTSISHRYSIYALSFFLPKMEKKQKHMDRKTENNPSIC